MLLDRRQVVTGLLASGLVLAGAPRARAAAFPAKDINFIIPFASGGGFDGYVRAVIPAMQSRLPDGIQVIPDNVDGAGGAKAANQLFRAHPDGYTISVLNVPGVLILQQQNSGVGFELDRLSCGPRSGNRVFRRAPLVGRRAKGIDCLNAWGENNQLLEISPIQG